MEMLSGDLALVLHGAKDIVTFELPLADKAGRTGVSLARGWALRFHRGHGNPGFSANYYVPGTVLGVRHIAGSLCP